jgi:hypothetical protein
MPNIKVTALDSESTPAAGDLAPISKSDGSVTKKCTLQNIAQLFSDNTVVGHSATDRITNIVSCTTAEYNALTPSSTTLYFLTD